MQSHREIITTDKSPTPVGPYCQAVKANGMIFVSGLVGKEPGASGLLTGVEAQTRRTLENLKNVLEAGGSNLSKVMKCTVLLTDMANFGAMNAIYAEYFPADPPARTTFAVVGLPLGALVEIDAIALE
jgi:2-iminobutanoate/2-iminopropanoate deaminase